MTLDERLLVAVDVDGTLLNTEFDDVLGQREIQALDGAREAGHVVALCTGRNLRSVNGLLQQSGWQPEDLPMILLNGALVWGGTPRRQLACNILQENEIRDLVRLFKKHGLVPMIYDMDEDGGVLHHEDGALNEVQAHYLSMRKRTVGAIHTTADLQSLPLERALEVGTIDQKERVLALTAEIRQQLAERVRVINTESLLGAGRFYWVEVFRHGSDKGAGVRTLANACGIPLTQVVAIGDNYNDLDMFAAAGLSVAMGNSPDDVRKQADLVTAPVQQSGAARVLEQIASGVLPG